MPGRMPKGDNSFVGSIPELYQDVLVPLIFEPYAADLTERLAARTLGSVLEVAAGTGVVTRSLAEGLPDSVSIVATDLNQPMLDKAAAIGTTRPVVWQEADAEQLPFDDGTFDAVVCQFGVMFFPDRRQAYREARRVLRVGGVFLFNAWDSLETNEIPDAVSAAVAEMFPSDPPDFLARIPHGYFRRTEIERDLVDAGFETPPVFETIEARSRVPTAREAAVAFVEGTPLFNEIEARDPSRVEEAVSRAAREVARRFGEADVDAKIQAHVVQVEKTS